jgi:Fe-S-cluster containining protein
MVHDDASAPNAPEAVFDCLMCGVCCEGRGGIVVSDKDLERLCRHLALGPEAFEREWGERRGGKLHVRAGEDGYCVFFVKGRGCRVHEAKPDICRAWPFFRGNLLDEESFALAKADCPGISRHCGHESFAREGLGYLLREGLAGGGGEDEAAALRLDDLLEKYGFPHK